MEKLKTGKQRITSREKIIQAARKCLIEKGGAAASVKTIARMAGVNHGLIHHYFGSKENLFIVTLKHHFGLVMGNLEQLKSRGEFMQYFKSHVCRDIRLLVEARSLAYQMPRLEKELQKNLPLLRTRFARAVGIKGKLNGVLIAAVVTGLAIHSTLDADLPIQKAFGKLFQTMEPVRNRGFSKAGGNHEHT